MADQMAIRMGISNKPISKMTTIEKLDAQAEKEFEIEKSRSNRRGTYETIVSKRDNRTIGRR